MVDVRISAEIGTDHSRLQDSCAFTTATTMPVRKESNVSFVSPESAPQSSHTVRSRLDVSLNFAFKAC